MNDYYGIANTDTCRTAARKIFSFELQAINNACQGMLNSEDTGPLHDLRVAIRKFRAALKLFKTELKGTSANTIDIGLTTLADDLSGWRDSDAWLEYLLKPKISAGLAEDSSYQPYLVRLREQRRQNLPSMCFLLNSKYQLSLLPDIQHFIDRELKHAVRKRNYRDYAGGKLLHLYDIIIKSKPVTPDTPDQIAHQFRKRCRRGRYWSEFSLNLFAPHLPTLHVELKTITGALGDIRDLDIQARKFSETGLIRHEWLRQEREQAKKKAWRNYRNRWKIITGKRFRKTIHKTLSKN